MNTIGHNRILDIHNRMDWKSVTFDWNRARAFLVTAEEGSLSAAARALGMSQPTLGRQVTALEKELDIALFERAGPGLILTPAGADLLKHVQAMGDAARQISLVASGQSESLEGDICISASEVYAVYILPPIIEKLRNTKPEINIELVASNSESDLRLREADIALRNFQPTQPELIAKRIKDVNARLYASPRYLQHFGRITKAENLNQAVFIGFDHSDLLLNEINKRGFNINKKNMSIITGNHVAQWEMVKRGLGIGIMPEEIGDTEPLVERVLNDLEPFIFPIWLTTHRELRTSRRVRFVYDLLANELRR